MTTDRLYLPFQDELDIKLKDEPSILDKNYRFDSRLIKDDFITAMELGRKVEKPKIQTQDNRLLKLKNTFDNLFGVNNLRRPPFVLAFEKLDLIEEFKTGIDINIKKKETIVTLPINNVDSLLEKKSLG